MNDPERRSALPRRRPHPGPAAHAARPPDPDAYAFLLGPRVLAPAGSFYAYEPFRRLAPLEDEHALRLGLAPYSDESDVARVLAGLREFLGRR
jgi:selenocysteine lyase/cysteine desulfurase